jgi:hypothetical protein
MHSDSIPQRFRIIVCGRFDWDLPYRCCVLLS